MFEHALFIIVSYGLLGAGIKYIDQAYDIGVFDKGIANFVAVPSGILMASLIIFDPPSATIFLALFIALAVTRKIDNLAFYIGTGILLLLPIIFHDIMEIEWLSFGVLIFAGIIDEVGNDWADKRMMKKRVNRYNENSQGVINGFLHRFGEKFFLRRFMMKMVILLLVIFSLLHYIYFFAFIFFDVMYLLVEQYSLRIKYYTISRPGV